MIASAAWAITKGTVSEFMEDGALRLAAALAYYAMFSIGPLLVIVIAVASLFFEKGAVREEVSTQVQSFVGQDAAETVDSMLSGQQKESSVIATILGTAALLFGATGVFGQLQDALNTIWEVKPKPGRGIWAFIRTRFLSLAMVLGIAFLLLVSMVITTALELFSGMVSQHLPEFVAKALHFGISFVVITLLFAMIFKLLPDAEVRWRDVWVGAIGTSLLFTAGKFLMGYYLGQQSTNSAYGAAGSVVVLLLWVYYSSLILFFGAEFTQVYAKKTGSHITPAPHAVRVTEETRAQEGIPHQGTVEEKEQRELAHTPMPYAPSSTNGQQPPFSALVSAAGAGFVSGWLAHRMLNRSKARLTADGRGARQS